MRSWTKAQKATVALTIVYAIIFVCMLIIRPGSRKFYDAFFNTYQILPPLFAGIVGLVYYKCGEHKSSIRRIGWLLISLGCLSFALGQATWTYLESILRIEVPFPSWADAGFIGNYVFLIAGVMLLFGSMPMAGRARQLLDSAIASSGMGVLSWYFLVRRIWHMSDISMLGKCISVAYPLGDIAALFGALVLLSTAGANKSLRRSLYFLAMGILGFTFFDTSFTWMSLNGTYQTGSWSDWTISFGWILIGYSLLTRMWWVRAEEQTEQTDQKVQLRSMRQILVPYVAVTVACAIVGTNDYIQDKTIADSTVVAGMFLMMLVVVRQILTLIENRTLTVELKMFNDNLEKIVAQRTEQLTALHNLTKAVSTTMCPDDVLRAAMQHTKNALGADGIVIWLVEDNYIDGANTGNVSVKLHYGFDDQPKMLEFLADQAVRDTVDALSFATVPQLEHGMGGSCLRAPLRWQQSVTGMIGVVRWNGEFGSTECQLLESIGLEVGTALENARLYSAAVEAADVDSVTGLLNHRAVHQRLERVFQLAKKNDESISIILMDMDNFKLFNDTYGHPVGDEVLRRVGKTLKDACRTQDILGRYGGDEFIAVLQNTSAEEALSVAQMLRETVDSMGFTRPNDDRIVPVSLSLGIASFPNDSTNRHELLTIADANLLEAKRSDGHVAATTDAQRENRQLRGEGSFAMLDALITAVDNKDRYTRLHSEGVTEYALWIAEEMRLSEEALKQIRIGSLLHDVGKIGVPDDILRKPGRLDPEEYEILQRHPWIGSLIVSAIPGMEGMAEAMRCHHERWDGNGYPGQLKEDEIPLIGRIMAVADAFSAMTTDRAYRRGLGWDAALNEIRSNRGTQFDPTVVDAFLRAVQSRRDWNSEPYAA